MSDESEPDSPSKLDDCSSDSLPSPSSSAALAGPLVARVQHLGSLDPRASDLSGPGSNHSSRGRTKNKDEKWCGVCGDKALGYNFDAVSCESCKAFFRRNANKGVDAFKCPYNGECKMDRINRRFCKRCRLKKCFEIGMRKEYILTEDEKYRKRALIEHNRRQRELRKLSAASFSSTGSGGSADGLSSPTAGPLAGKRMSIGSVKSEPSSISSSAGAGAADVSRSPVSSMMMGGCLPGTSAASRLPIGPNSMGATTSQLHHHHHGVLSHHQSHVAVPFSLLTAANGGNNNGNAHLGGFGDPSSLMVDGSASSLYTLTGLDQQAIDEVVRAYKNSLNITVPKEPSREAASSLPDLINIAEVSIRRVINMCKNVGAFRKMTRDDQTSLLKGGSIELLVLRSALTFDKDKERFLDPTDREEVSAMTAEQLRRAEINTKPIGPQIFEQHFGLIKSLVGELNADEVTMILLLVICLFSPDRPGLIDIATVSEVQERYSLLLQKYLYSIYDKEFVIFFNRFQSELTQDDSSSAASARSEHF